MPLIYTYRDARRSSVSREGEIRRAIRGEYMHMCNTQSSLFFTRPTIISIARIRNRTNNVAIRYIISGYSIRAIKSRAFLRA